MAELSNPLKFCKWRNNIISRVLVVVDVDVDVDRDDNDVEEKNVTIYHEAL